MSKSETKSRIRHLLGSSRKSRDYGLCRARVLRIEGVSLIEEQSLSGKLGLAAQV